MKKSVCAFYKLMRDEFLRVQSVKLRAALLVNIYGNEAQKQKVIGFTNTLKNSIRENLYIEDSLIARISRKV